MGEISAVLLMAYGSPNSLEEVAPYYREIRGGRTPTDQQVQELTERYRSVGGSTPLLAITREVAVNLEQRLGEGGDSDYRVYVGMKHWHPFISQAIQQIAADGVGRLIGVPLAPHYSRMSIDGYRAAVEEAIHTLPTTMQLRFIESWHENPLFIGAVAEKVRKALGGFPSEDGADVEVVFTAHSLPRSIRQWDDPYPRELLQSCEAVAAEAGVASWRFAYQSASHTGQPWLGPDILESLATLAAEGKNQVLVVPIGFVSDNLEIVFDLDMEAQELAGGLDMYLRRAEMLNASQAFIEALADLVVNGTGARLADLTNKA